MGSAVKLKDSQSEQDRRSDRQAMKAKKDANAVMTGSFSGKVFGDLTGPEKDDLLKTMAIMLGVIEE